MAILNGLKAELFVDEKPLQGEESRQDYSQPQKVTQLVLAPKGERFSIRLSISNDSPMFCEVGTNFAVAVRRKNGSVLGAFFSKEETERFFLGSSHELRGLYVRNKDGIETRRPFRFRSEPGESSTFALEVFRVKNKVHTNTDLSPTTSNNEKLETAQIVALGSPFQKSGPRFIGFHYLEREPFVVFEFKYTTKDEPLETKSTTPSLLSIDIENRPTETLSIQELRELFRRLQYRSATLAAKLDITKSKSHIVESVLESRKSPSKAITSIIPWNAIEMGAKIAKEVKSKDLTPSKATENETIDKSESVTTPLGLQVSESVVSSTAAPSEADDVHQQIKTQDDHVTHANNKPATIGSELGTSIKEDAELVSKASRSQAAGNAETNQRIKLKGFEED